MTPKKFSMRFLSEGERDMGVNSWPMWEPVERRIHLEELGFRSNGLRRCQHEGCTATCEEWLTPEGDKRELDPSTLVPHAYKCALSQKASLTVGDIAAIPILGIGFFLITVMAMGGYFGPRSLNENELGWLLPFILVICFVVAARSIPMWNKEKRADEIYQNWLRELYERDLRSGLVYEERIKGAV